MPTMPISWRKNVMYASYFYWRNNEALFDMMVVSLCQVKGDENVVFFRPALIIY